MSNPFPASFDSKCDMCGVRIPKENNIFAVDFLFICADCANSSWNVCGCGNFKKSEFETCFQCKLDNDDRAE